MITDTMPFPRLGVSGARVPGILILYAAFFAAVHVRQMVSPWR